MPCSQDTCPEVGCWRPIIELRSAKGLRPEGLRPEPQAPEGLRPEGLRLEPQAPEGLRPKGLRPEPQAPEGLRPEGLRPEPKAPGPPTPEDNDTTRLHLMQLGYCEAHKTTATLATVLSAEGFSKIAKHLRECGKKSPVEKYTTLAWVKLDSEEITKLATRQHRTLTPKAESDLAL